MAMPLFKGAFTALITPFKDGAVDADCFAALVERQIEAGIHGVIPSGTTGECPTLTHDEHITLIRLCVEVSDGRVPVVAGTGSNNTQEAIELTQAAQDAGADGAMLCTPYYNKPSQEGMFRHFKAVHDATNLPIMLYNIPGRSVVDMDDSTILRLSRLERIVALKDATGDLARPSLLAPSLKDGFALLSGEDATAVAFNVQGGTGCVSVTSNIVPAQVAAAQDAFLRGDIAKAVRIDAELQLLHSAMFCSPSPGPAKYALSRLGLCSEDVRLPMTPPEAQARERIDAALERSGVIGAM